MSHCNDDNDNGTNAANPINEDNIIADAEQIQLTNRQASAVELRARVNELALYRTAIQPKLVHQTYTTHFCVSFVMLFPKQFYFF